MLNGWVGYAHWYFSWALQCKWHESNGLLTVCMWPAYLCEARCKVQRFPSMNATYGRLPRFIWMPTLYHTHTHTCTDALVRIFTHMPRERTHRRWSTEFPICYVKAGCVHEQYGCICWGACGENLFVLNNIVIIINYVQEFVEVCI